MENNALLELDNQLCFALYACAREVTKLYRPFLDELGITYTQYVTLLALWEKDEVPVKELGRRLYLDSGTLTPLLKKLESMKLLRRDRDPQDERSVIVRLTDDGRALKERAAVIPERVFCQTSLSPEEIASLRGQLQQLTADVHTRSCEGSRD
ncbi:MarR family winged helix-turn-helix transcriptional regulator [Paenibacillus sacheonensis]|uniref:MarR family transcriptional regulator n=1 Tax=Paenibacillus sacheonensis TaxID=742054 RepID=A0A7X4YVV7_9BACL|nr:MarR family transcriptional regulator [Paenibacillus sacheonensis]MBM7566619.1 DNA-binding MarR family transcriptional regulator [Paenibacillus sacheonensis]NBC73537.1 MarR family transcriptional regulator [Paenibacillus sacheonensis]